LSSANFFLNHYPEDLSKIISAYPERVAKDYLIMEPIQAQGYTPGELDAKDRSSFIREILEYGKVAA